jgi:hypothetical protein
MELRQSLQVFFALDGQPHSHGSLIVDIGPPYYQAGPFAPIDQLDGAVVADEKVGGHVAHRWPLGVMMAAQDEQQLMLAGGEAHRLRLVGAPTEEAPQAVSKPEQLLVLAVREAS